MRTLEQRLENVDFVGKWRLWFSISFVLLALGAGAIVFNGLNLGIDFTGGTEFTVTEPEGNPSQEEVLAALPNEVEGEANIQSLGEGGYEVATPPLGTSETTQVSEELEQSLGAEVSTTDVSPTFGGQSLAQALQATGLALLVIIVYISYRFEFSFSTATVVALLHDIIIAVGFYALIGREVSLVTVVALLTVLGYSVYDTIIIFDRLRENTSGQDYERASFEREANRSVRQVVRRSIYTSLSTLVPVMALMIFGGGTLADFAVALGVGVAAGAYSSIFIATPVLALYKRWRGGRNKPEDSKQEEATGPVV